jgi:hypothetical protein
MQWFSGNPGDGKAQNRAVPGGQERMNCLEDVWYVSGHEFVHSGLEFDDENEEHRCRLCGGSIGSRELVAHISMVVNF